MADVYPMLDWRMSTHAASGKPGTLAAPYHLKDMRNLLFSGRKSVPNRAETTAAYCAMRGGPIRSFTMSRRFPVLILALASSVVILRSTPNTVAAQTFGSASGRAKWARDFKGEWSPTG